MSLLLGPGSSGVLAGLLRPFWTRPRPRRGPSPVGDGVWPGWFGAGSAGGPEGTRRIVEVEILLRTIVLVSRPVRGDRVGAGESARRQPPP